MPPLEVESGPSALAAAHFRRGLALRAQNRPEDAVAELRAACAAEPGWAEAHHQLGNAYKSLRRYSEAAASLRAAARLAPADAAVQLNLGVACLELALSEDAVACFRRAIELEPARPEAHNILGHALLVRGRCTEARASLVEALRLRPGYPAAHDNLGRVLKAQGRAAEAVEHHRIALAGGGRPETHSNLLYTLNLLPGADPGRVFAEHRGWALRHAVDAGSERDFSTHDFKPSRRLKIGYISADFVNHAVAYFFAPVLESHDRGDFETFCYSDVPVPDETTRRLQTAAGHWRDIAGWGDERVASLVREDRIDILVDLAGHTARNRLLVFARRPAPIQVTWLGYPNTTGLQTMDYRLTDAISDPPGRTEAWHTEKLVRLPEAFCCYGPASDSPEVGPLPALGAGRVTFGCCNNLAKINSPVIELWSRILREAPASRLILESRGLADPETAGRVRREFTDRGVERERVDFDGEPLSVSRHLARYHSIDIAFDPFPYNGVTTTCEALWMGVPVVTLAGEAHVGRVGASLLAQLGASEWVASSPDDYAAIALGLARDPRRLGDLRRGLRERMRHSPLCDAPRFARGLEKALRQMWRRAANKKNSPRSRPPSPRWAGFGWTGFRANQNNRTRD
jgi:predicted O-linked N-acetylglucosamine transferase (SPINDLY family)